MSRPRRRNLARRALMLPAAAILAVAGACGGGDDDPDDDTQGTTTTADATTTTTTELTPEEEAEAVYLEFVEVVYRLLTTWPDPNDPDLERLAIEPVLGRTRDSLSTMRAENHIVEKGSRTSQHVLSSAITESGTARLRVCSVGNDVTIDQDDGKVVDEGLSTYLLEVTVESDGGQWKTSDIATIERFDGEVTCPE